MTLELGGKVTITCEKTDLRAELDFKLKVAGHRLWEAGQGAWVGEGGRLLGLLSLHPRGDFTNMYT
jgi:hypothetical protein